MVSLSRRKTGEWVVKYYDETGSNCTLYLGQMHKRSAEEIHRHASGLIKSKRANVALPSETAALVGGIDQWLRWKLERLGLIKPGMGFRRVTSAEFTAAYIEEKRPDSSPITILNLDQAGAKLMGFFGKIVRSATSPPRTQSPSEITSLKPAAWYTTPSAPTAESPSRCSPRRWNEASSSSTRSGSEGTPGRPQRGAAPLHDPRAGRPRAAGLPERQMAGHFQSRRTRRMRPKEIIGLCWEDVRWERNLIHLHGAKGWHGQGAGMWGVPLFPEVAGYRTRDS